MHVGAITGAGVVGQVPPDDVSTDGLGQAVSGLVVGWCIQRRDLEIVNGVADELCARVEVPVAPATARRSPTA